MRRLLDKLLVLLQDLLQLCMLLHERLVLEARPLVLGLLPLCGGSLQLLQPSDFVRVPRGSDEGLQAITGHAHVRPRDSQPAGATGQF